MVPAAIVPYGNIMFPYGTILRTTSIMLSPQKLGRKVRNARLSLGLTQHALATRTGINRTSIAKIELGQITVGFADLLRIAGSLNAPLQLFLTGKSRPPSDLPGIATELFSLGIRDLVVSDATVPGAFRHAEEVAVLAVRGDRPEVRVIEAMPFVLAGRQWRGGLLRAFAAMHDKRALPRLAWLAEIAIILGNHFEFKIASEAMVSLSQLIRMAKKPSNPDDLGYPGTGSRSPVWKRWNITYGGGLDGFRTRATELGTRMPTVEGG
jgi:transcriptional regulator with XRE-family HTH domain